MHVLPERIANQGPPFIRLAGVRKVYGDHLAISDATFDVLPGELVSLVGPSGCGKSTLLRILAGLHPHDGGEVRIGSPTHPFDPSRDVGMVFQAPLLLKWRRILENVLLPAEILGPDNQQVVERGLLSAGQQRSYKLGEVGRIKLGNVNAVEVKRAGVAVDLEPFSRANVARFTLSSDGSLAPVAN